MYFDGEIPDYRLIGTLNPGKTPETPDLSGLTRFDCIGFGSKSGTQTHTKINLGLDSEFNSIHFDIEINKRLKFLTPKMFGSKNV